MVENLLNGGSLRLVFVKHITQKRFAVLRESAGASVLKRELLIDACDVSLFVRVANKWHCCTQHGEQDDPQGPDVDLVVARLLLDGLWGEVADGASGVEDEEFSGEDLHGEAEVCDLDLREVTRSAGNEDVQMFEVAVNDVVSVNYFDADADLSEDLPRKGLREAWILLLALIVVEIATLGSLCDQVDILGLIKALCLSDNLVAVAPFVSGPLRYFVLEGILLVLFGVQFLYDDRCLSELVLCEDHRVVEVTANLTLDAVLVESVGETLPLEDQVVNGLSASVIFEKEGAASFPGNR